MTKTKKQKTEPLPSVTPKELERGKAFAAWLSNAISAAQTNAYQLSLEKDLPSSTYIYWLLDNGISNIGEYKRPSEDVVRALARHLNANLNDGLKAAGYDASSAPHMVSELASLPIDIQHDVADLVRKLRRGAGHFGLDFGTSTTTPFVRHERTASHEMPQTRQDSPLVTLPVKGFAGAVGEGFNIFAEEHQEGELALPARLIKNNPPDRCFIVRVRGNCLAGSLIGDGDFAVCVAAETANDGDIVLVGDGDDAVLKRYREEVTPAEGTQRWLETDEASGVQKVHHTEYIPRIMGRMIALHREM